MGLVATTLTEPSEGRAQAIAFLIDAYEGVRTAPGKGLPHAQAVADILRDAGYDQRVQVVGLLHDVVEDTPRSIQDVRDGFGETIAAMVQALTEDDSIHNYAQRKHALRAQVIGGTTVICTANGHAPAALRFVTQAAARAARRRWEVSSASPSLPKTAPAGGTGRCPQAVERCSGRTPRAVGTCASR